jgi:hypothetical protein
MWNDGLSSSNNTISYFVTIINVFLEIFVGSAIFGIVSIQLEHY